MIMNKPRVLVVCYEEEKTKFYKSFFRDQNCDATGTTNPDNAIQLFQNYFLHRRPFHLVCVEWQLKGMNGISLARHLDLIYPEVILHLLPTEYFYEATVFDDFRTFGAFIMKPDDSYEALTSLIDKVKDKPP